MNRSISDITSPALPYYLNCNDRTELKKLFLQAEKVAKRECGSGVLLRGIVEISSHCRNTCCYCGLRGQNTGLQRFRLSMEEILSAVGELYSYGIKTVVLQSGEDSGLPAEWISRLIERIKQSFSIAVTLSFGEWPYSHYRMWRQAGADRYLLKIETTDRGLYHSLHPGMDFDRRIECIKQLQELGYQTGSGIIVGLPGQSIESIAADLLFLQRNDFDMISIGPFIPHPATPLKSHPAGSLDLTCTALALARCLTGNAHIPATSALAATQPDRRHRGLISGANVIMPNFTPPRTAELYDIYPHSGRNHTTGPNPLLRALEQIHMAGKEADFSRGDSLKPGRLNLQEALHE